MKQGVREDREGGSGRALPHGASEGAGPMEGRARWPDALVGLT